MKNEKIYSRLEQIFTQDELSRFAITEKQSGVRIVVNVHGLKCFQVRQLLNNLISVLRMKFHLLVIHGYNHGTAIKNMLENDFKNCHVTNMRPDPFNKGVTHMSVI